MEIEFAALIERGREERSLEYKSAQPWETLRVKIIKTALGMANLQDGGVIVIGVEQQQNGEFIAAGVGIAVADTFKDDTVRAAVNEFAEPHLDLGVHRFEYDGRLFVIIAVSPFETVPIIARRPGEGIREGAIYTRPLRMPETREIQTSFEMRELLDLATEKALARYLRTLSRAGVAPERLLQSSDAELFARERDGL